MEPTQDWIEAKKKQFGRVFKTTVNGDTYYFRTIKRPEHLAIQADAFPNGIPADPTKVDPKDNARVEDQIVEKCLLWPEGKDIQTMDAGAPPTLVAMILQYSGFGIATEPEEV